MAKKTSTSKKNPLELPEVRKAIYAARCNAFDQAKALCDEAEDAWKPGSRVPHVPGAKAIGTRIVALKTLG